MIYKKPVQYVLLDIEGTTTDIDFVHQTLFPYAAERMTDFIETRQDHPLVREAVEDVMNTVKAEENVSYVAPERVPETLMRWIEEDRKHTALKTLQGLIWESGYTNGDYQGHVYDDVPEAFERWKNNRLTIGIYSSGSVHAQKQLFEHSTAGDLTPYFANHFDTTVGGKKEIQSYITIAQALELEPEQILFLSDVPEELEAAHEAGLQVMQITRDDRTKVAARFQQAKDFNQILRTQAIRVF